MKFTFHTRSILIMLLSLLHNETSHALPRRQKDDGIKFNTNSFARRTGSTTTRGSSSSSHLHHTTPYSLTSLHDEFPCESNGTEKDYTGDESLSDDKIQTVNAKQGCSPADVNTLSQTRDQVED